MRTHLSQRNLCRVCEEFNRLRALVLRLEREHPLVEQVVDHLATHARHVRLALAGPPGHSDLAEFYVIYEAGPLEAGTATVYVRPWRGPLVYDTDSEEERQRVAEHEAEAWEDP